MRTALIVSPCFPPSPLAGAHRARHLARHLPACGWHPIVLTVDEQHHEQRLDPALARLVPPETEVVRVGALRAVLTRRLGIGDVTLRAWWQLRAGAAAVLTRRAVDVVMITAPPSYALLLAPMIRRRFGIPVVLDFQDPWVSRWGARQPRWSKAGLSHRLATRLEPIAVGAAHFVTSVSEAQNAEMAARYPWLARTRMAALPVGGDPSDFDEIARGAPHEATESSDGSVTLAYVGSCWPAMEPALRVLLAGLARLRLDHPQIARRMRLRFVGTDATAIGARESVRPVAAAMGVGDLVEERPERVPYLEALAAMRGAHGLLLIGSDEPHYTASKIYPALMSGRPYLSLFHARSSAHGVLAAAGGGVALSFSGAADLARLVEPVAAALRRLAAAPETMGKADPKAWAPCEARAVAGRFAEIFERIATGRRCVAAGGRHVATGPAGVRQVT